MVTRLQRQRRCIAQTPIGHLQNSLGAHRGRTRVPDLARPPHPLRHLERDRRLRAKIEKCPRASIRFAHRGNLRIQPVERSQIGVRRP